LAAERKSYIRKENISETTVSGLNVGKFACERGEFAFRRVPVITGLALLPAIY